jgi:lipopolysaccharide export system protein LptA
MVKVKHLFRVFALLCLGSLQAYGQAGERIDYEAEQLEGGQRSGESFVKLVNQVKFSQKSTIINADSAYLFRNRNALEAFGRVRIFDLQDSVTITADRLDYDGNSKMAKLRGNVVYIDDSITLYTDNLDYDMTNRSARYFDGGRIVDGVNTLSSRRGVYDTENRLMEFREQVNLTNPDYTLLTEELFYNIITKKARSGTRTEINTPDGKSLVAESGSEFDTSNNTSAFFVGEIDSESHYLRGDRLFYNQSARYYSASGNVLVYAKKDDVIITGEEARFWENEGLAKVYGKAILKKPMTGDTLYLAADTLVSIDDEEESRKRLLAYRHVRVINADMQGKADSMAYFLADSVIRFYRDPVLWNEGTQITADSISMLIANNQIDRMLANVNAFIISRDSTANFNQVKGRSMVAYFADDRIDKVDVTGNGESIYFALDEEDYHLIGMNRILCSNIRIVFLENELDNITFLTQPDALFIPPHELKEEDRKLDGFAWRDEERPLLADLFEGIIRERSEPAPATAADGLRRRTESQGGGGTDRPASGRDDALDLPQAQPVWDLPSPEVEAEMMPFDRPDYGDYEIDYSQEAAEDAIEANDDDD